MHCAVIEATHLQAVHDDDDVDCLKLLLTANATYYKDKDGKTVAHVAADKNALKALQFIVGLRAGMSHVA